MIGLMFQFCLCEVFCCQFVICFVVVAGLTFDFWFVVLLLWVCALCYLFVAYVNSVVDFVVVVVCIVLVCGGALCCLLLAVVF